MSCSLSCTNMFCLTHRFELMVESCFSKCIGTRGAAAQSAVVRSSINGVGCCCGTVSRMQCLHMWLYLTIMLLTAGCSTWCCIMAVLPQTCTAVEYCATNHFMPLPYQQWCCINSCCMKLALLTSLCGCGTTCRSKQVHADML